jgi:hypothetical protein
VPGANRQITTVKPIFTRLVDEMPGVTIDVAAAAVGCFAALGWLAHGSGAARVGRA